MQTTEYSQRLINLLESGAATTAQKAEVVGAVLATLDRDTDNLKAIHAGIGWPQEEASA